MAKRPKSDLIPIGALIDASVSSGYLGLAQEMVRVFSVWEEAVGPYNASKSKPDSIKNGRLTILVESPVWIDHFSYMKTEFMERINQTLGAPLVKEIVFLVGSIKEPEPATPPRPPEPRATEQRASYSPKFRPPWPRFRIRN